MNKNTDYYKKPLPEDRSVEDAILWAEQCREDFCNKHVVQVRSSDWDRIILTDEIYRLRRLIKSMKSTKE